MVLVSTSGSNQGWTNVELWEAEQREIALYVDDRADPVAYLVDGRSRVIVEGLTDSDVDWLNSHLEVVESELRFGYNRNEASRW